jgi:integrase
MIQIRYTKQGKRRYRVRYETPFGRETTKTFARKEDAEAYERWVKDRAHHGSALPASRLQRQRAISEFWREVLQHHEVEARTRARYEDLWRLHVGPVFARLPAAKVTTADIRAWTRTLTGQGLSPATIAQCVTVVSLVMREAIDQGVRLDNPAQGCRPKVREAEPGRSLSSAEVAALVAHAGADGPVFLLAAVTGLRFGELAGLRVGDLDVALARLSIQRTVIEIRRVQSVKPYPKGGSGSRRVVGLPDAVSRELAAVVDGRAASAWLWPGVGTSPITYARASSRLRQAMRSAGLTPSGLHILRRTAATLSLQTGTNLRDVQAMLGHKSPLMTMTRYAIPDLSAQTAGSERVAGSIAAATRPKSGHRAHGDGRPSDPDRRPAP